MKNFILALTVLLCFSACTYARPSSPHHAAPPRAHSRDYYYHYMPNPYPPQYQYEYQGSSGFGWYYGPYYEWYYGPRVEVTPHCR